ncbi:HAD-IA family hydrolase [Candidatus Woesearchaeota archaeon]|nr:HAD-IA family hydrolase [Candidatus Woesearchaeota archaeon]
MMVGRIPRAVIFDIDDTLSPTSKFIDLVLSRSVEAMKAKGMDIDSVEQAVEILHHIRMNKGEKSGKNFDLLCKAYDIPTDQVSRIVSTGVRKYHQVRNELLKPNLHAREVLEYLSSNNYKLGVVTNGNPKKQRAKLTYLRLEDHLAQYFYASNNPATMKPNPYMLQQALSDMGVEPNNSFYVGDRPEDVLAAHRAGMKAIRYLSGKHRVRTPVSVLLGQGIPADEILEGKHDHQIKELTPDYIITELRKIKIIAKAYL